MHLTYGTTLVSVLAVTVVPAVYDSTGSLVLGMLAVIVYVLEALPSSCILLMPFLSACSFCFNWFVCTGTFASLLVLY